MGRAIKDKTGERYERLVVLSFHEIRGRRTYWKVKCDCGNIKIARGDKLTSGVAKSCGCLMEEKRILNLTWMNHTPHSNGFHFTGGRTGREEK